MERAMHLCPQWRTQWKKEQYIDKIPRIIGPHSSLIDESHLWDLNWHQCPHLSNQYVQIGRSKAINSYEKLVHGVQGGLRILVEKIETVEITNITINEGNGCIVASNRVADDHLSGPSQEELYWCSQLMQKTTEKTHENRHQRHRHRITRNRWGKRNNIETSHCESWQSGHRRKTIKIPKELTCLKWIHGHVIRLLITFKLYNYFITVQWLPALLTSESEWMAHKIKISINTSTFQSNSINKKY